MDIAKETGCKVVTVNEIARYLQSKEIDAIGANIGGTIEIDGVKYTRVPAVHSNGIDEAGFGWDAGSPADFVIGDSCVIYHAGDTAVFQDMSLIHELYKPRVAMLPIGGRFTMDASTALMAVKLIKPGIVIPMHYNTFDVIQADANKFKQMVEEQTDSEVIILKSCDTIEV